MIKKLTLVAAAMVAMSGSSIAGTRTFNIVFDGFCDGVQLTVHDKVYVGHLETGTCVEGEGILGSGVVGKIKGQTGTWILTGVTTSTPGYEVSFAIQYPLVNGGVWADFYTTDGVAVTPLYSGTYSLGTPASSSKSKKSATSR